jgi:serine/threonine protein kinase
VTDFGISRDWSGRDRDTTQGPTYKTLRYCAPEVATGEAKNSSSDIWSLGCVFLEIWTVLSGHTTSDLTSFMETTASKSRSYYANTDAVLKWYAILARSCSIEDKRSLQWISSMLHLESGKRCTAQSLCCEIEEVDDDPEISYSFTGRCCTEDDDGVESVASSDYEYSRPDVVAETFTAGKVSHGLPSSDVETLSATVHGSSPQASAAISRLSSDKLSGEGHLLERSRTEVANSQALHKAPQSSTPTPYFQRYPQSTFERQVVRNGDREAVDRLNHHISNDENATTNSMLLHNGIVVLEDKRLEGSRFPRPLPIYEAYMRRHNIYEAHMHEDAGRLHQEPDDTIPAMDVAIQPADEDGSKLKTNSNPFVRGFYLLPAWSETDVMRVLRLRELKRVQRIRPRLSKSLPDIRSNTQMSVAERKASQHLKHQGKKPSRYPIISTEVSVPMSPPPVSVELHLKELLHTTNGTLRALMFGRALNLDLKNLSNLPAKLDMNREECKALKSLLIKENKALAGFLADDETFERRLRNVKPRVVRNKEALINVGPYVKTQNPLSLVAKLLDLLGFAHLTYSTSIECSYPSALYRKCVRLTIGGRTTTRAESLLGHMQNAGKDAREKWRTDLAGFSGPWKDSWSRGKIVLDISLQENVEHKQFLTCTVISGLNTREASMLAEMILELCTSQTGILWSVFDSTQQE